MTREEINKVFDFLEKEMNKEKLFYFKINDASDINAFWKSDNRVFAEFYTKRILKYLKEKEEKK